MVPFASVRWVARHVLHFGSAGHRPSALALKTLAGVFGLSRQTARRIVDKVRSALMQWHARFDTFGVSVDDRDRLAADIERRLQ